MRILNNSDCPKIISKLGRKIDFRLLVKVETTIKNTIVTYELREDSNGQYLETCYYRSGYVEVLMEEDDFNNFDWENDKNEDISVYSMGDKIDWDYKDGNINQNYDFNSSDYEDSEEIFSGALKTTIISNLQISDKSLENLIKS